jgi:hypothetical protein
MEEAAVPPTEGPPPLPYSLRQRKKSIFFFWSLFVIDTLAQPLILYFALRYATSLSLNLGRPRPESPRKGKHADKFPK